MGRDHLKLTVFHKADELALLVYRHSRAFPPDERYGLRAQVRRAALSIPTNIVEGSARNSRKDYIRFLDMALGSSAETLYLLDVAARLDYIDATAFENCRISALAVRKMLEKMIASLRRLAD